MRIGWGVLLAAALCIGTAVLGTGTGARADGPATVSFIEVGAQTFIVPAGVTSIHVVAVGAPGASVGTSKGGAGGIASADVAVTPGEVLGVYVGGAGAGGKGGFNGGGNSTTGSGGGASDVRVGSPGTLESRLVTAGGGGGAASQPGGFSLAGGSAGASGESESEFCSGGGGATSTGGGSAGAPSGQSGTLGAGALGPANAGGGGGGGLFGGGSGGGLYSIGAEDYVRCGGGGGSSGFGPGTSATSVSLAALTTKPSVTISYVVSTSTTPPGSTGGSSGGSSGGSTPGGPTSGNSAQADLSLPKSQRGKAIVGTVVIPANRSSLKATLLLAKAKGGSKRALAGKKLTVGSLTEAPLKKGLHSFTVKLNGKGKKKLAKLGKLKLILSVKVTPPQGAVAVASKSVTLKP
jgi:hypothetical protein